MSDLDTGEEQASGFPAWQGPLIAGAMFGALALVTDHAQWEVSAAP